MKQELPIAVGLLAIGGLLWLSGSWTSSPESQVIEAQRTASTTELQSSFVQQATYQAESSLNKQLPSKPINPLIAEKDALDEETIQSIFFSDQWIDGLGRQPVSYTHLTLPTILLV